MGQTQAWLSREMRPLHERAGGLEQELSRCGGAGPVLDAKYALHAIHALYALYALYAIYAKYASWGLWNGVDGGR